MDDGYFIGNAAVDSRFFERRLYTRKRFADGLDVLSFWSVGHVIRAKIALPASFFLLSQS